MGKSVLLSLLLAVALAGVGESTYTAYDLPPVMAPSEAAASEREEPDGDVFRELRARVPYTGLSKRRYGRSVIFTELDDTGIALQSFLEYFGEPEENITGPESWDNEYILIRVLTNAVVLLNVADGPTFLRPIAEEVGDDNIILREHVEAAALELFGVKVTHQSVVGWGEVGWVYHEAEDVYTPPHGGIPSEAEPVVFGYQDKGDHYQLEVAYVSHYLGYFEGPMELYEQEVGEVKARLPGLPRYAIRIDKNEDGTLTYRSSVKLLTHSTHKS